MKRILSYIFPIRVKHFTSAINGHLEVSYINGKKILDTDNSNYSYGSLQRILHKGLIEINFDDRIQHVLVLGMGGGSIVETIRCDFKSNALIELVEIDPEIISIAQTEFGIKHYSNTNIILADAAYYIKNNTKQFDLIIIDLFIGNKIPEIFIQKDFLIKAIHCLKAEGIVLFNTMRSTLPQNYLQQIITTFTENGMKVWLKEKVEATNDLIFAKRKSII